MVGLPTINIWRYRHEIIFNDGDVDIDDIAIFQQFAVIRDTVTDHFHLRNADGFRKL